jgi:hypothetical protein
MTAPYQTPPHKAPDVDALKRSMQERYAAIEKVILGEIDHLANTGFADKRWASIARTHFEQGIMAMDKALRLDLADPNEYGKVPAVDPFPKEFTPRVDPAPRRNTAGPPPGQQTIEDYNADGGTKR